VTVRKRTPALIFDFGNVVAHFDYRNACQAIGPRLGLSSDALLDHLRARGFSPLVQQYERGQIDSRTFSRSACSLLEDEISPEEFAAAWADIFWLNDPVAALIPILSERGYALVLGSNTNDLHATQFRRQFAQTLAHFDRLVLSYEIGHIKPTAPFYHACAEAADTPPEACVFIDDLPENVEGARAAGLSGLVYRDFPGLLEDLGALGVEVPNGTD
jgi:putative hydrolase of the HAD superfamily